MRRKLSEVRNKIGELPLTPKDESIWRKNLEKFQTLTKQINNKIDKYNLLVPILQKQMLPIGRSGRAGIINIAFQKHREIREYYEETRKF